MGVLHGRRCNMSSEIRSIAELTAQASITDADRGEPTVARTTYKNTGCRKCEGNGCNQCVDDSKWVSDTVDRIKAEAGTPEQFAGRMANAVNDRVASAMNAVRAYQKGHLA